MKKNAPNKFIAPVVIAGITLGFLATAYSFIFTKPKKNRVQSSNLDQAPLNQSVEPSDPDHSK